jgi:hypothetical protein
MRTAPASRVLPLLVLSAMALVPFAVSLAACGGSEAPPVAPPPPPPPPAVTAEPTASAVPTATATPPASVTPPPPPPAPTSTVASTKSDPGWVQCHVSFQAKRKDVSADVAAMAKSCAATTKMKPVGKTFTGKQADQDAPQTFALEAKANHCYRAYAQASDGIKDLDLAVKDSAGIVVGQDSTDDPSPVVLEDGAICFSKDDKATVVVAVGMGKGTYAVQVWGN